MLRCLVAIACASCGRFGFGDAWSDARPHDGASGDDALDCSAITEGLLGYWPLDLADVSGSAIADRSGNGHDGTVVGSTQPTVIAGRVGEALDFAPTNRTYIDLPTVPLDSSPGASTTVVMWFWHDDPDVNDVLVYLPEAMATRYDLWLNATRIDEVSLCVNTGENDCWGISDPGLLGRWVHVAAVFANGVSSFSTLYVDGVDAGATCRFNTCDVSRSAMGPLRLGGDDDRYPWKGKLDDVRVYDRALSADEVWRLYACTP